MVTDVSEIPGLRELWVETLGDPRICIAILDGPVDRTNPSLTGANLAEVDTLASDSSTSGSAAEHGTHVASVIFGQHDGPVKGIAPECRGMIAPIFTYVIGGSPLPCSQVDLARALLRLLQAGANIINVSGGQFSPSGTAHPVLADAVRTCAQNGAVVVAAALLRRHGAGLTSKLPEGEEGRAIAKAILDRTTRASTLNISRPTPAGLAKQMLWATSDAEIVRLCLLHTARPKDDPWWNYVLIHVTDGEKLKLLLDHGIDPDVVGDGGFTPFHHLRSTFTHDARPITNHGRDLRPPMVVATDGGGLATNVCVPYWSEAFP